MPTETAPTALHRVFLFAAIFLAGLCSIIYELLVSTTSSYFLGDSVKQFSLVIGVYMATMGLGSFLSKYIGDRLLDAFVRIELALGFVGGLSVPVLYYLFGKIPNTEYQWVMLGITAVIGTLTGFEIPVLVRLLRTYLPLESNLSYVLGLDYIGALAATLLFPFLLLPFLGTFRTALLFGFVNIALGLLLYALFRSVPAHRPARGYLLGAVGVLLGFAALGYFADCLLADWEDTLYQHKVVYSEQTPYQKLVLTQNGADLRLYLNRVIQFSSLDEYRYHEALALVPLASTRRPERVLILGGGEGLLAREVLRDERVQHVTIVDLDPAVVRLARENPHLRRLNAGALDHPRVTTVAADAMTFLQTDPSGPFDLILADLPDPSNDALVRLYSTAFYRLVRQRLSAEGVFATQASGVFHTPRAFWCIGETLRAAGFKRAVPYHAYVPSFGDWGFYVCAPAFASFPPTEFSFDSKFIDSTSVGDLFRFPPDLPRDTTVVPNRLDQPVLLDYFLEGWERWRNGPTG